MTSPRRIGDAAIERREPVATRRELDLLVSWCRDAPSIDDSAVQDLITAGLITGGDVHPAMHPVVEVLREVQHRAVLRRWSGGRSPITEVFVGPAGVVVLPGGHDLDAAQHLRWHPRRTAAARVVAELLQAPAHEGPPVVNAEERRWGDLVRDATEPSGLTVVDLGWARRPSERPSSVLAAAWAPDGGLVEILPVPNEPGWVRCQPRHPIELWTGLTALVGSAIDATGRQRH